MRRKRDNFPAIDEMRKLLTETKRLTLENFIMPEEDEYDDMPSMRGGQPDDEEEILRGNDSGIANIEKELIQIRKIALSVINRLADQTSSESYDTMKRIWSLVDKAIESKNDEDKQGNNMHKM